MKTDKRRFDSSMPYGSTNLTNRVPRASRGHHLVDLVHPVKETLVGWAARPPGWRIDAGRFRPQANQPTPSPRNAVRATMRKSIIQRGPCRCGSAKAVRRVCLHGAPTYSEDLGHVSSGRNGYVPVTGLARENPSHSGNWETSREGDEGSLI